MGLISNPTLLKTIQDNQLRVNEQECEKIHLEICDMWCPSCAELITWVLGKEKGIKKCVVDYATDLAILFIPPNRYPKRGSIP